MDREGRVERVRDARVGADGLDAEADDRGRLGQPARGLGVRAGRLAAVEERVLVVGAGVPAGAQEQPAARRAAGRARSPRPGCRPASAGSSGPRRPRRTCRSPRTGATSLRRGDAGDVLAVAAGDPVDRRVEVGADVLADGQRRPRPGGAEVVVAADVLAATGPGVFANGGGSCSTGVVSLSGCVRSTTRTEPSPSAVASGVEVVQWPRNASSSHSAQMSGSTLGVQHERAVAVASHSRTPSRSSTLRDGEAAAARRLGERGEVGGRELGELDGDAHRPEVVDLGAVGRVVVDHDEHVGLQPRRASRGPAAPSAARRRRPRDRQPVGPRDRRADRVAEREPDALEGLREDEALRRPGPAGTSTGSP